jgi:hypothetical protein
MQLVQLLGISPVTQCIRPQKVRHQTLIPLTVARFAILAAALLRIKGKGKTIPLQALTSPEGFWRLRLPDFKTIGT